MKRTLALLVLGSVFGAIVYVAFVAVRIQRQSTRDEARPADVIIIMGAAGRELWRREFGLGEMLAKLEAIYEELAGA
jgi:hypothetical protein